MRLKLSPIVSLLLFMTAVPNLLLLSLVGTVGYGTGIATAVAAGLVVAALGRGLVDDKTSIGPVIAAASLALALALCLLGGQGRWFYANPDWQIRDALFADLVANPWPFSYVMEAERWSLRAPLAIYLAPALIGKIGGERAAALAFLAQNTLYLGLLFCAVGTLLRAAGQRLLAILVVAFYGGPTIVGYALFNAASGRPFAPDHIEAWSDFQFSSVVTQVFWVPHHCFPGFLFALAYVAWLGGRARWALPIGIIPLVAFWSPLAMIGTLPFGLHVGMAALLRREVWSRQIALPIAATLTSLAAIVYLRSGAASVPTWFGIYPLHIATDPATDGSVAWVWARKYVLFLLTSVVPALALLALARRRIGLAWTPWVIVTATLVTISLVWVGEGGDFGIRASIPALFVLTIEVAKLAASFVEERPRTRWETGAAVGLAGLLALGSVTAALEIRRAIRRTPVAATCNLVDAWRASFFSNLSFATYLARPEQFPDVLRPRTTHDVQASAQPRSCWTGEWAKPHLR